MQRHIKEIIVHCSATPPDMDIGVDEIRQWHMDRGWSDVGYHYVIRRNGLLETGRPLSERGAHCKGRNQHSIGVCLVGGTDDKSRVKGECNYTMDQFRTLDDLLHSIAIRWGEYLPVLGHRDVPGVKKACPCFNVRAWWGTVAELETVGGE